MNYKYKISTVVPVYNVEVYLEQAIESVIHQSIGFKDNIQLILVNDGSKDNSNAICEKYQLKYPNNIIYISKENEGVSVARNVGFEKAEGKYVNFLDSDDYLDLNFYEKAYKMLEENQEIDLVAARIKYFEALTKYHWLDYKFTKDKIIDIKEEPQNIHVHINSSLIRYDAMKNIKFDSNLKFSEDTKTLFEIILQKEKYGILSSCIYHYRRRKNNTSAMQNAKNTKLWYTDTLKQYHDFMIDTAIKKYKNVIPFIQHYLMYDLQWRIKSQFPEILNEEEYEAYKNSIKKYLKFIDDEVILFQKFINKFEKIKVLKIKYEEEIDKYLCFLEEGIYYKDKLFMPYEELLNTIDLSYIEKDKLIVEGSIKSFGFPFYCIINNNKKIKIRTYQRAEKETVFEEYAIKKNSYILEIPLKGVKEIKFAIKIKNKYYTISNEFIHFSKINSFKQGYYYENKYLITKEKNTLKVEYKPFLLKIYFKEIYFLCYLLLIKKRLKVVILRVLYWLTKPFYKNIWLFSDREFMAKDSGEFFFKYVNNQIDKIKRNTYFVVNKKSNDYKRMKQYGKVVSYHTLKYKLLFLHARYVISSHADGYVNNAFGKSRKYYIDLFNFEYIYLTHGILLHDSSSWLNRINKNITLNVVTSPLEYKSMMEGNYYFKPEQLMKSGLPRYDCLLNLDAKEENKILIMASWRSSLVGKAIVGTQNRAYNPKFKESEYFKFYDKLFNDKRLQEILREYQYKIKFCIHPSFRSQYKDFKGNELVEIAIDVDSQYETKTSKMLITDYSSAACDFAYLRKPVIYANFDIDSIYQIHYYNKGYFDYDKNGYGPNCKTYEETVQEIIKCIKNNCQMENKYKKRCDQFFYHHDDKNCKRVYEILIKHDKNR